MQLSDTVTVPAPRDRVVAAFTDAALLQNCIPGCTSVRKLEGGRYEVEMSIPTGLRSLKVSTVVRIDTTGAPDTINILRGGQGRVDITLVEDGVRTVVNYDARAKIGGPTAMLGSRLLSGVVRRIVSGFFDRLGAALTRTG